MRLGRLNGIVRTPATTSVLQKATSSGHSRTQQQHWQQPGSGPHQRPSQRAESAKGQRPPSHRTASTPSQEQQQQQQQQPPLKQGRRPGGRFGPGQQRDNPPAAHRKATGTSSLQPTSIRYMQWAQLQEVVHEHLAELAPAQLVAVVLRLAKLQPQPAPQQQHKLLEVAWNALSPQLGGCQDYEVALVLWAAAKVGYTGPGLYAATLERLLSRQVLTGLTPRFLSTVVYATASAPPAVRDRWAPAAAAAVLPEMLCEDKLAGSNAQDVANVLWALGTLGTSALVPAVCTLEGLHAAMQQLLVQLQQQCDPPSTQAVANTLWALARLECPTSAQQLLALTQALLAQSHKATAQDASSSLWALAVMQQQLLEPAPAQEGGKSQQGPRSSALVRRHVQQLLEIVAVPPRGQDLGCHSLALALWATSKLGVDVPHAQLQRLLQLCVQHSSRTTAQDVANIMWACASISLQQQASHQQQDQLQVHQSMLHQHQADILVSAAVASAHQAEAQAIANILWAVAKLGLQIDLQQLRALVKAFSGRVLSGAASSQNISNTLWALATLQTGTGIRQQQQEQHSSTQQHWRHVEQQQQQQEELAGQQLAAQTIPQRVVKTFVEGFMLQLPDSTPQEVSNVLWASAKMQHCVAPHQMLQLVAHLTAQPVAAARAVKQGHGGGQQRSQGSSGCMLHPPQQHSSDMLLSPQEAATALWSVATMQQLQTSQKALQQQQHQQQPVRDVMQPTVLLPLQQVQQLLSVITQDLHCANDQQVCNALWAAARLEPCVLPAGLLSQDSLAVLAGKVSSMNLQCCSNLAYALGQLGVVEASELLEVLLHRGLQLTQELTARNSNSSATTEDGSSRLGQAIANLCWSAAVLGIQGQADVLSALAAAFATHCWTQLTPEAASQLFMLHLTLQLEQQQQQQQQVGSSSASDGLLGCLTPQQLQECRAAWMQCGACMHDAARASLGLPAGAGAGFRLQRKVFAAACNLQGLQAPPELEALTWDQLFSVDIIACTASGTPLAIEVDGPCHHRLPDMGCTGTTLFRNRQLAARGYLVVSVPFFDWNAAVAAQRLRQQHAAIDFSGDAQAAVDDAVEELAEGQLGLAYLQGLVDTALTNASMHCGPAARDDVATSSPDTMRGHATSAPTGGEQGQTRARAGHSPGAQEAVTAPVEAGAGNARGSRRLRAASPGGQATPSNPDSVSDAAGERTRSRRRRTRSSIGRSATASGH